MRPVTRLLPLAAAAFGTPDAPMVRQVDHDGPASTPASTTVDLTTLSTPGRGALLCAYLRPDMRAFRRAHTDTLRHAAGGALGVEEAALVVGTGGDAAFAAAWRTLPAQSGRGMGDVWTLAGGPRFRLDPDAPKGLQRRVEDPAAAREASARR